MPLAIFDLDNTLLNGDSDYSWGEFLVAQRIVDPDAYSQANQKFYRQYEQGDLDIFEYSEFSFRPLAENSLEDLLRWRTEFLEQVINPMILAKGKAEIEKHHTAGNTVMIITATNSFITTPIAEVLGVRHLMGTDPEFVDGRYTGRVAGVPCFQDGKVKRLQQWLQAEAADLDGSFFYSDSYNDMPLLEQVDHPVAVDADVRLTAAASERGWDIVSFRE